MARLMVSAGMLTSLALAMMVRRRKLVSGSPPLLAANWISLERREKTWPRFWSKAPLYRFTFAHLLCPLIVQTPSWKMKFFRNILFFNFGDAFAVWRALKTKVFRRKNWP